MPSKLTSSVHAGSHGDPQYGGIVNPIYPSSAYDYEHEVRYPRYFNTPNQDAVVQKMIALEHAESGLVFSSGMAAITTSVFGILSQGDHIIFQENLYGGTHHTVVNELQRHGISHSLVQGNDPLNFEQAIRKETRAIYIETPSNPLLAVTDIEAVGKIAKRHNLVTLIDNTFASPVNQNPIDLGIDIVLHSGTKYIGGHSDLCCGVMVSSKKLTEKIRALATSFGGSLDAHTCYLVERSLKTLVLRVRQQNANALEIAHQLAKSAGVTKVNYPGLKDHPGHDIAKRQMIEGFGGMLSFEVKGDPDKFMKQLKIVRKAVSLGGVESTICSPAKTSHAKVSQSERTKLGISDKLVRFSVGIEDANDLLDDLNQALKQA